MTDGKESLWIPICIFSPLKMKVTFPELFSILSNVKFIQLILLHTTKMLGLTMGFKGLYPIHIHLIFMQVNPEGTEGNENHSI